MPLQTSGATIAEHDVESRFPGPVPHVRIGAENQQPLDELISLIDIAGCLIEGIPSFRSANEL